MTAAGCCFLSNCVHRCLKVRQLKRVLFERLEAHNATACSATRLLATSARHLRLRCIEQSGSRGKVLRDDESVRKALGRLLQDGFVVPSMSVFLLLLLIKIIMIAGRLSLHGCTLF